MKKLLYNKKLLLSLFDSYKPLIAAMAFLIISISSSAQYYDSTKILQAQQSYGFSWKNGKFYNLQIPQDTSTKYKVADSNYISIKNGVIYRWNGYAYVSTSGSTSLPYWELATGGALTGNNNITGSHSLTFTDQTSFNVIKSSVSRLSISNATTQLYGPSLGSGAIFSSSAATISGNLYSDIAGGASSGRTSSMRLTADETTINPSLGVLIIDSLATSASPTHLLTWISTAGTNRGKTQVLSLGTGIDTWISTPSSANLRSALTDETGTGSAVFGTAPTFTTSITSPLLIGGTGTTDDLILRTTSGVGASGADMIFQVGNNGATEAMRILNSGNVGIGVSPSQKFHVESSGTTALFKSTGYSASTVIIEDPDGTTYLTNGQFKVNTVPFILNANGSYLSLQTAGVERINIANAGDITLKGATILATPVTTGIDLSGGSYNADDAGLYDITKGDVTNSFSLPDATTKTGKTIKVIVKVGESAPIIAAAGVVYDKLGAVLSTITGGTYTFISNGTDWWEF